MARLTMMLTGVLVFFVTLGATATPGYAQAHESHSGSGDRIVRITRPSAGEPFLLVVQGNAGGRHFSLTGFTDARQQTDLLVNTTDSYSGIVAVDLPPRAATTMLEVSASGPWQIDVYAIGAAQKIEVPGSKTDSGDSVLWLLGDAVTANISGNPSGRHFAVTAFDGRGNQLNLLVNTTDVYTGEVFVPQGTLLLKVEAVGAWTVTLNR